jgi:glutathione S-transferase
MSPWVTLATVASLLFYIWTGLRVGRGRATHGVEAPAMTGHPVFERLVRVQANTLEWLVIYLPCLWLFGLYVDGRIAAGIAVVWIVGRAIYAQAYAREPGTRTVGFLTQAIATLVLMIGAAYGAVSALIAHGG